MHNTSRDQPRQMRDLYNDQWSVVFLGYSLLRGVGFRVFGDGFRVWGSEYTDQHACKLQALFGFLPTISVQSRNLAL